MITINITNNFCIMTGEKKETLKLYNLFSFRNPNAFYLRQYMPKGWDGKYQMISTAGRFSSGLLPRVLEVCEKNNIETVLKERRPDKENIIGKITQQIRDLTREYQLEAIESIVTRRVKKLRFPRGAIKA